MANTQDIKLSKYIIFNVTDGKFCLTLEALEKIYREKNLICSCSGSNEWAHHFVCEMIDFCSGCSIYNYALCTVRHEKEIPKVWEINKKGVIEWAKKSLEESWSKKMYKMIDYIIDEAEKV